MNIDDEMVEATAKRINNLMGVMPWHQLPESLKVYRRDTARNLLGLIAPMVAGQALQEAAVDLPIPHTDRVKQWLMMKGESLMEEAR